MNSYKVAWSDTETGRCGTILGRDGPLSANMAWKEADSWKRGKGESCHVYIIPMDEGIFEALNRVASDSCHGGAPWHLRARLKTGTHLLEAAVLEVGRGWVRLDTGDGTELFLSEDEIVWATIQWDPLTTVLPAAAFGGALLSADMGTPVNPPHGSASTVGELP
jgi:hypothetical protein